MKLLYLVGNVFMLLMSICMSLAMSVLEYRWVTDASMQHAGIKYAGGLLCIVCVLFVYLCVKELVSTIKGKE